MNFNGKSPIVIGLYLGVMLGAVAMMIMGALGFGDKGDLALIMGLCAGPALGWTAGKYMEKKNPDKKDDNDAGLK